jgi:hypothetical protein
LATAVGYERVSEWCSLANNESRKTFERLLRARRRVLVGMQLDGKLAVRQLDAVVICRGLYLQDLVQVLCLDDSSG